MMFMGTRWLGLIVLASLLLTACGLNQPKPVLSPSMSQVWLSARQAWQVNGTLSVQKEKKLTLMHYRWRHRPTRDEIELAGAFNFGATRLHIVPGLATIRFHDGQLRSAPSAARLMKQQLGWSLPIEELRYWVRGLVAPGALAKVTRDARGRLQALSQEGWRIEWLRYQRVGSIMMPALMVLTKPPWTFRVFARHWQWLVAKNEGPTVLTVSKK